MSSRRIGRSRAASGACWASCSSAAAANRSSPPLTDRRAIPAEATDSRQLLSRRIRGRPRLAEIRIARWGGGTRWVSDNRRCDRDRTPTAAHQRRGRAGPAAGGRDRGRQDDTAPGVAYDPAAVEEAAGRWASPRRGPPGRRRAARRGLPAPPANGVAPGAAAGRSRAGVTDQRLIDRPPAAALATIDRFMRTQMFELRRRSRRPVAVPPPGGPDRRPAPRASTSPAAIKLEGLTMVDVVVTPADERTLVRVEAELTTSHANAVAGGAAAGTAVTVLTGLTRRPRRRGRAGHRGRCRPVPWCGAGSMRWAGARWQGRRDDVGRGHRPPARPARVGGRDRQVGGSPSASSSITMPYVPKHGDGHLDHLVAADHHVAQRGAAHARQRACRAAPRRRTRRSTARCRRAGTAAIRDRRTSRAVPVAAGRGRSRRCRSDRSGRPAATPPRRGSRASVTSAADRPLATRPDRRHRSNVTRRQRASVTVSARQVAVARPRTSCSSRPAGARR